ncbi:unnamed protein product [Nippostrongylus brasiliensis]|uniref:Aa_trans domain-containing protein n=1 Tax=Nippostrongylus brasiliensis TaxID=27835 RepID=A0A0N4YFM1_NIPBR|nr:unnamed protein product [Nippostrongylus brasiliensis]
MYAGGSAKNCPQEEDSHHPPAECRSYVWRAIFLTSFTLGIRFGNIDAVSGIFLGILGSTIVFIITYICVPGGILYVDKKVEKKQLTIEERRVMLIGAAAFLGVLGSAVNQHYVIKEGTAPSYFLPGLVAGPHLGQHRIPFLAVSVGTAFMIGVMIMAYADDLGFGTLFSLTISAICATINLQILVAAIIQHKVDMMSSHVVAVLMALYQHLLFSRLLGEYNEEEKSTPSITNPILYS